ncbi:response regulator [Verrucomicrobiota bacterium sgz303538]
MSKAKILVVDDDPKLSRLVKVLLENTKLYEVCEVNRPTEALATARAFRPDGILLDVDMPGKDGGELAREMGADPHLCSVPLMFFTSLVSGLAPGEHEVERGGRRFLAKPVNPGALIRAISRLLGADKEMADLS